MKGGIGCLRSYNCCASGLYSCSQECTYQRSSLRLRKSNFWQLLCLPRGESQNYSYLNCANFRRATFPLPPTLPFLSLLPYSPLYAVLDRISPAPAFRLLNSFPFIFGTCVGCLGYIGEFEEVDDHRSGKVVVQLNGRVNKCGVISPRFNVQLGQIENWVQQLLPARSFGYVVLTTSAGIMDHEEARRKHVAGKILGFFY